MLTNIVADTTDLITRGEVGQLVTVARLAWTGAVAVVAVLLTVWKQGIKSGVYETALKARLDAKDEKIEKLETRIETSRSEYSAEITGHIVPLRAEIGALREKVDTQIVTISNTLESINMTLRTVLISQGKTEAETKALNIRIEDAMNLRRRSHGPEAN